MKNHLKCVVGVTIQQQREYLWEKNSSPLDNRKPELSGVFLLRSEVRQFIHGVLKPLNSQISVDADTQVMCINRAQ
ncbi:hypothetical protein Q5P01_002967 [Channa striata]|uniref:Uncharacterized protein n=1 Tax=Channa striata TaxID=64152 RepID=A0AA88T8L5_CHASR|nr:hypothetical protein Q5P01_002967 [Channa striata]